jgi:ribonuclease Y
MDTFIIPAIIIIIPLFFGIGYFFRKKTAEKIILSAEIKSKELILEAEKNADTISKEMVVNAKEDIHKLRGELDIETKERRQEIKRLEDRNLSKEENLEIKSNMLDAKDEKLELKSKDLSAKQSSLDKKNNELSKMHLKQIIELERISELTLDEAKQQILFEVEKDVQHEKISMIKRLKNEAEEEADKNAKWIISYAIQKCSADFVTENTVSIIDLPNDEMKGRIIGREGRNIRAIERLTGVDLIIDDTPEAVILSSFDPIRREIARITLEKLIIDGRIHPARIEEMVNKATNEFDKKIKEVGENATFEANIHNLHPKLVQLLGRLKFRTSFGQNVLKHSLEVSYLAGLMAAELGANVRIAKRAGLLHDIGKAVDHEMEGTHVEIGMKLLKKYNENDTVIHAMSTHHGDYEPETVEAVLVTAADALSAARPGARRETLDNYIQRLESLENIANSYDKVESSYAIQAGREIRVLVKPDDATDDDMVLICRDIKKQIEDELDYPGQIRITVIRETRTTDYAK